MEKILAWHFGQKDGLLGYGDKRKIEQGITLSVTGEITPCENGLHGSIEASDALRYAKGPLLSRCELSGTIMPHGSRLLCRMGSR